MFDYKNKGLISYVLFLSEFFLFLRDFFIISDWIYAIDIPIFIQKRNMIQIFVCRKYWWNVTVYFIVAVIKVEWLWVVFELYLHKYFMCIRYLIFYYVGMGYTSILPDKEHSKCYIFTLKKTSILPLYKYLLWYGFLWFKFTSMLDIGYMYCSIDDKKK